MIQEKPQDTVPCSWCNTPTTYTGTGNCKRCHELVTRISRDPELAARMVGYYSHQNCITELKIVCDVKAGKLKATEEK